MKIGIITFHWAVNYGAVLQAFALQKFLELQKNEVEVINYRPFLVIFKDTLIKILKLNFSFFLKKRKINKFISRHMRLSSKTFRNNKSLRKKCIDYDVYICGSDQIWNTSFSLKAELKPTLSYFLDFVSDEKKRIAYAASFGSDKIPENLQKLIKPELEKFTGISLRENTGVRIIEDLRLKGDHVLDPTLLIDRIEYENILDNDKTSCCSTEEVFVYIIHENQTISDKVLDFFSKSILYKFFTNHGKTTISIDEWLFKLSKSEFVITNSFHGVIFSIIFHRPFIVTAVEGSKMNDRIKTILEIVGLQNRYLEFYDELKIKEIHKEKVNWSVVDSRLNEYKDFSKKYILNSLNCTE